MSTKIKEIKNLTKGSKPIDDAAELQKFGSVGFNESITADSVTATTWAGFAAPTDNIQVSWSDDNDKIVARAVGGKFDIKGDKVTIKGLVNASRYGIGLNGELIIGPEGTDKTVAVLRVRIGNLVTKQNPSGDLIIDFSDKSDDKDGSYISLQELIDWIKSKTGDSVTPELPDMGEGGGEGKTPSDFNILFKNFYFNVTQKTFDFWVVSKGDEKITFGNFTIQKVGFRITNVQEAIPAALEEKATNPALEDGKEEE